MRLRGLPERPPAWVAVAVLLVGALATWALGYRVQTHRQKSTWVAPLLSGATALVPGQPLQVSREQMREFDHLDDRRAEDDYRFTPGGPREAYTMLPPGYSYWVALAHALTPPTMGSQRAVILLQCLLHLGLAGLVLSDPAVRRWPLVLAMGIYLIHPLVVRYVAFNHYYFFQTWPTVLGVYLLAGGRSGWRLALLALPLPLILLSRPSSLAGLLVGLVIWAWLAGRKERSYALGAVLAGVWALGGFYLLKPRLDHNPWHTAYIGVGAWPNPFGIALSDTSGYALYERETGVPLNASLGGNFYDPPTQARYATLTRERTLAHVSAEPLLYLRNAALNTAQAFCVGHLAALGGVAQGMIALAGLALLALMAVTGQWAALALGLATVGTFTVFYPPIPAYMLGNYLLICFALTEGLSRLLARRTSVS